MKRIDWIVVFVFLATAVTLSMCQKAGAQEYAPNCNSFSEMHEVLLKKYDEKPVVIMRNQKYEKIIVVFANFERKSWTVVKANYEMTNACILEVGQGIEINPKWIIEGSL